MKVFLIILSVLFFSCKEKKAKTSLPSPITIQLIEDTLAKKMQLTVQGKKIDTFIFYTHCSGGCFAKHYDFLFWMKDGHSFVTSVQSQYYYGKRHYRPSIRFNIDTSKLIATITDNLNRVRSEDIQMAIHVIGESKKGNILIAQMQSHDDYTSDFAIFFDTIQLYKRINHFDLDIKQTDDGTPNDNYEANQKTILKEMRKAAENAIFALVVKNNFADETW